MQFLEPAWWLLAPVAVLAWSLWRKSISPRWLAIALVLIAAMAGPVLWISETTPQGEAIRLKKSGAPSLRYLGTVVPTNLRQGERFSAKVTMESDAAGIASIRLFQNGILVGELREEMPGGRREVVFSDLEAEGPLLNLESWMDFQPDDPGGAGDSEAVSPESLRAAAAFAVGGALDVVIVDAGAPPGRRMETTDAEKGVRFRFVAEDELRTNPSALFPADVIILDDVPVGEWPEGLWQNLRDWVLERGGSLLQSGGPGLGSSQSNPEERAQFFPLEIKPPDEEEDARAVLVVLDRSGSMAQKVGENTKMALANEGTLRVAAALRPGDWFGVLAVDVAPTWILPLTPWRERSEAVDAIRAITPGGGGIYIDTALRESWNQLRSAVPRERNLLVFADADDVEEKAEGEMGGLGTQRAALDLATLMRADQITISVVALGFENDKDTSWLRELAGRGRGRFHRTEDARQLPGLFRLEADEAGLTRRNALPFFVVPTEEGRTLFREVDWEQAPPLLDQNPAVARPGAEVWLEGRDGLPLLAYWRQGRGQTSSFVTSWRGAWSVEWDRWPGAAQFRGALLRWLAPVSDEGTWEVLMQDWNQRELVISLRWLDQAKVPPPQPPLVALTSIDSKSVPLDWNLLGPGSWQARVPLPDTPVVLEGMVGAREQIPLTVWNPLRLPPPEFAIQLQPADWRKPIVLRPWILAALIVGLAVFGPFGYRTKYKQRRK